MEKNKTDRVTEKNKTDRVTTIDAAHERLLRTKVIQNQPCEAPRRCGEANSGYLILF